LWQKGSELTITQLNIALVLFCRLFSSTISEGLTSRRKSSVLAGYFGIKVSLGLTCNILKRTVDFLKSPTKKIQEHVLQKGGIRADETSWRVAKKKNDL